MQCTQCTDAFAKKLFTVQIKIYHHDRSVSFKNSVEDPENSVEDPDPCLLKIVLRIRIAFILIANCHEEV